MTNTAAETAGQTRAVRQQTSVETGGRMAGVRALRRPGMMWGTLRRGFVVRIGTPGAPSTQTPTDLTQDLRRQS